MALATPGLDAAGPSHPRPARRRRPRPPGRRRVRRRAHAGEHRPAAPRHPRRAPAGARARGRDGQALHSPRRLPALRLREAGRVPALQPDHPAHRPHRLPLADGQQRLPRAGGREADGDRGDRAVPGAPGDRLRDEPDHLAPRLARHHRHRPRRVHPVPLVVPGAGADLQPAGAVDRRPAHHQPHPRRRHDGRHPGRLRGRAARLHPHLPQDADEVDTMFTRNAIWIGRTQGVGALTAEEAINYSLSGPMLRASGVDYDVRKDRPYLGYETYDFDVPGRRARRHLRPLPGPAGGDVAVEPDPGAGARPAGRSSRARRSTWTTPA